MVKVLKHKPRPKRSNASSGTKRRSHRKSRNGCRECKQRHVKCDENRPACVNCSTANQSCSYLDQLPANVPAGLARTTDQSTTPTSSGTSAATPSGSSIAFSPASSPLCVAAATGLADDSGSSVTSNHNPRSEVQLSPLFSLSDLALFHHLETIMTNLAFPYLATVAKNTPPFTDMILKFALSAPYLMDELLAFAALHLSTLPSSDAAARAQRHHQAAELQARALVHFHATGPQIHDENCTAMFLFSALLGMHVLFDTVACHRDFVEFLDKFIQFLGLHHGVRTFTRQGWHVIRQTDLSPIIDRIEVVAQQQARPHAPDDAEAGAVCGRLAELIDSSSGSLSPEAAAACYEAIKSLRWVLDQHRALPDPLQTHVVLAWPVIITADYIELLKQRRPEALVILAHWGVPLHLDRDFWVFGDAGRFLIESVARHLGPYWDEWLAWPKGALA